MVLLRWMSLVALLLTSPLAGCVLDWPENLLVADGSQQLDLPSDLDGGMETAREGGMEQGPDAQHGADGTSDSGSDRGKE